MLEAIRGYQELVTNPPAQAVARLLALAQALDALAMAYHHTPDVADHRDCKSVPAGNYDERRKSISPRFPELGLYASIVPGPPSDLDGVVGDAIDDLVDIALDLEEVLWRSEHVSQEDAAWHFRFGYLSRKRPGRDVIDQLSARSFASMSSTYSAPAIPSLGSVSAS
jgi:hypothetical protein